MVWNHLKSLKNRVAYGHPGIHFSQAQLGLGEMLLSENKSEREAAESALRATRLAERHWETLKAVVTRRKLEKATSAELHVAAQAIRKAAR